MERSGILKCLGVVFLGVIILGILGRMGHMLMGFIILGLALIGAIVLFQKLTGIDVDLKINRVVHPKKERHTVGNTDQRAIEHRQETAGSGQILCPHCGAVNLKHQELCVTCGWPLPARVQKSRAGVSG